jgi:hypothetical protein
MKKLLVFIIIIFSSVPIDAAQDYVFETLTASVHPVPSDISIFLLSSEAEAVKDCQRQLKLTNKEMANYFTAVSIRLSKKKGTLVLPTKYCYAFFGAHAVSFWIFITDDPTPRLILSGRQDGLRISDDEANGLPIIETFYGATSTRFIYNGDRYTESK